MIGPCSLYADASDITGHPDACPVGSGDNVDLTAIAERASEALYVLTGRQFPGRCTAIVAPRRRGDCWPTSLLGNLLGAGCCTDEAIPLAPHVDPESITVTIDGVAFTDFWLRNGYELVRTDGRAWPSDNTPWLAATEPGTFRITYSFGPETPLAVEHAATELGVHYLLAALGDRRTKLPDGTTSLSRQGQSVRVSDSELDAIRKAGIPSVTQAIALFNPQGLRHPTLVSSPDYEWDLVVVT